MRADTYPELRRQQQDRDVLVDTAHPRRVHLQDVQRTRGEHLLEHDAVRDVLAGRDEHRADPTADRRVPEDVVGARGLLDPVRVERRELLHPLDGLRHLPDLVGVDGDADVRAHRRAGDRHPPDVLLEVAADLELDDREAVLDGLDREPLQLLVVVAEPPWSRAVRRIALGQQGRGPLRPSRLRLAQDGERVLRCEDVSEVAEVDQLDDLLWRELGEQRPQRLALPLGAQVPQRVDHRTGGHVDHPLLGAEPAQLRVAGELAPERPEGTQRRLDVAPDDPVSERPDRHCLDVVATSGREHEAVPVVPVACVGRDHHVRG